MTRETGNKATPDPDAWSYTGEIDPDHWGEIAPICEYGEMQSPINLTDITQRDLEAIQFDYKKVVERVSNDGHRIAVHFAKGDTVSVNGRTFSLDHVHFHAPAEHEVQGRAYAMEAHFVNQDEAGNTAVVGVFFKPGEANPALAKIIAALPGAQAGKKLEDGFNVVGLLPGDRGYYTYEGSLTTPPGTENVAWYILKTPLTVSEEQARHFRRAIGEPNNRPLQPRNGRTVYAS